MKPEKKIKVIINQPVAVKGKHYAASDKPVDLPERDANYLLVRGKAKKAPADKKAD